MSNHQLLLRLSSAGASRQRMTDSNLLGLLDRVYPSAQSWIVSPSTTSSVSTTNADSLEVR